MVLTGLLTLALRLSVNLLKQFSYCRIQLRISPCIAFTDRPDYLYIDGARMHFHRRAVRGRNADEGDSQRRTINQCCARRVDDPASGRFAHNFTEMQSAV